MGRAETGQGPGRQIHRLPYLPGLDGLRALAVIAVVLFHADTSIRGGYLGVESFFVLSGYLITSLLVAEWGANGRIDLRAFWLRRIRRLIPALLVVIAATVAYAAVFLPRELAALGDDIASALAYVMNWHLILGGQSYFDPAVRPSLLQHLWSLAIEEQFYVLWPLLFIGGIRLLRVRGLTLAVIVGAAMSSLLMAVQFQPGADPSRLYYGTDTRAAGILIGVALALIWQPRTAHDAPRRWGAWVDGLGLVALGALIASYIWLYDLHPFVYRGGFATIALLTALVIVAVTHGSTRIMPALLAWSPLSWLGTRSYAIYLWHWPVFNVTRPYLDVSIDGVALLALRLAIVVTLAELSYRFVERPIIQGALGRWWRGENRIAPSLRTPRIGWRRYPVFAAVMLFGATCSTASNVPPAIPTQVVTTPQVSATTAAVSPTDEVTATTEASPTDEPTAMTDASPTDEATATTEATPTDEATAISDATTDTTATAEATAETTAEAATAAPTETAAQPFDAALATTLQGLLDATVADGYIPGASLAVYIDGQEPWQGTSGSLDRAGTPLQTDTRMRIASISKTFTAVVVLQLVEEGKLQLDSTLATYLPGLVPDADRITVRMLLNHTSGLYDYLEDRQFRNQAYGNPTRVWQPSELIAYAARFPLSFQPGAPNSFDYSSTNYVILGMLAEEVSGRTLAEEMRARIFEPLALETTFFAPQEEVQGTASNGYAANADQSATSMLFAFGTANIVSTPENLTRFGRALQAGELLEEATMVEMLTFVNGLGQYNMPALEYGLGIMRNQLAVGPGPDGQERSAATRTVQGHIGGFAGFRSALWTTPDGSITIAIGLNQSDAEPNILATSAFDAILTSLGR